MADALLSPVLDRLIPPILNLLENNFNLISGVDDAVENLEKDLQLIKEVLEDAERTQWKDSVKRWIRDLKDVSYDMHDILLEWRTTILKSGNGAAASGTADHDQNDSFAGKIKVRLSVLCRCFISTPLSQVPHRLAIAKKIQGINSRLNDIVIRKNRFSSDETSVCKPTRFYDKTSDLDVLEVFGQEMYKKTVLDRLLGQSGQNERELRIVIPIVGMAGVGKTTLAKQVYRDQKVIDHFEVRAWVCVSDSFDKFEIARAIFEQLNTDVNKTSTNGLGHQVLMECFHRSLKDKKFLLVLDDVWSEDFQELECLEHWLRSGAEGSRIMVTTRKEEVAKTLGLDHSDVVFMRELGDDDCWLLFKKISLGAMDDRKAKDLDQIGAQIAQKCRGLPLAAKTLASLLRGKSSIKEWEDVLYNDLWKLEDRNREMVNKHLLSSMFLSYSDLPSREKKCLSYCAIFPKAYSIVVKDLVGQWIAQDYFSGNNNEEEEGLKCFKNLAMRSLFQDFEYDLAGTIWRCKMHDVVHWFIRYHRLDEFSTIEITDAQNVDVGNSRHLSLILHPTDGEIPISICRRKNLHTLFVKGSDTCKIGSDLFWNLRFLRTLNLSRCHIKELPDNIDELIILKYLDLSYNDLRELPAKIGGLRNLQTLKLEFCGVEVSPDDTRGLPQEIGKLRELRVFSGAYISACRDKFQLGGFNNLSYLRDLVVENLGAENDNVVSPVLADKMNLYRVQLNFNMSEENIYIHKYVLEALKPPRNVEDLRIRDYMGLNFPGWMIELRNLKRLHLINCKNCNVLPPLGELESLETLKISDMEYIKGFRAVLSNLYESDDYDETTTVTLFPNLKRLRFAFLSNWGVWKDTPELKVAIMPRLEYLEFDMCPHLFELPDFLQKTPLEHLIIKRSTYLEEGCREEKEKVWTKIKHARKISLLKH